MGATQSEIEKLVLKKDWEALEGLIKRTSPKAFSKNNGSFGTWALHRLIRSGSPVYVVQALLKRQVSPNGVNEVSLLPIMSKLTTDIKRFQQNRQNAIHIATLSGANPKMVQLLFDHGGCCMADTVRMFHCCSF